MKGPALLLFSALAGCQGSGGSDPSATIADGSYDLSNPVCVSSGEAPAYPTPNAKVLLKVFDALTQHSLTLAGGATTETLVDADCNLTIAGQLFINEGGIFSRQQKRTHTWTESGCQFEAALGEQVVAIGSGQSDLFTDSDSTEEDLRYTVEAQDGGGYLLTTVDESPTNEAWERFGCTTPDQLRLTLSPRAR